jgi:hypothetical protein
MRLRLLSLVLLLLISLPACGGDNETAGTASAPDGTYVGTVEGSEAYMALVTDGAVVQGYLCDGQGLWVWLEGDVSGGGAELASRRGDDLGEATFSEEEAAGRVSIDGEEHAFTAQLATGDAGLYRATKGELGEPGSVEAGWIVLHDGSQRGGTNFIDPNMEIVIQPAPVIDPTTEINVQIPQAGRLRVTKFVDPFGQ